MSRAGSLRLARTWWFAGCAILIAVAIRLAWHLDTDVSWLLTLGERVLDGDKPYVDFIEVNPPASILLYLPAVMLGRLLHVRPESVVTGLVFAGAFASLRFCAGILRDAGALRRDEEPLFAGVALVCLLILPAYAFAQREHIALVAILPMLCVYGARASQYRIGWTAALAAGLAAGIAVAIKPYFALALILPLLSLLWRERRTWRGLPGVVFSAENLAAFGIVLAYGLTVIWAFPAFASNALPIVLTLYVGVVVPLKTLLIGPSAILWIGASALVFLLAWREMAKPFAAVTFLASSGFFGAALIQGKGWPYHAYPALALVLMLLGWVLARRWRERGLSRTIFAASLIYGVLLGASGLWFALNGEKAALAEAVAAEAPPHPKILAIASGIDIGHPLTRLVQGRWVGTACSQWMTANADFLLNRGGLTPDQIAKIRAYMTLDRALLLRDITERKPDVILVDGASQRGWARADAAMRAALNAYQSVRTVDAVEIWLRRDRATANAAP